MKLSILIPSRNEIHLNHTIEDILIHSKDDTEIIVGIDGDIRGFIMFQSRIQTNKLWVDNAKRIKLLNKEECIGQRALTNELARMSEADYLMKVDAHCSFSDGFDAELLKVVDDKSIVAPYLMRLDEATWQPVPRPVTSSYCFDKDLVFQYNTKAENFDLVNETMCLQGSAWVISRKNYWDWNICDETLGSWGGQATELGIKAFLNGGRCLTNKNCFYAHLFREKEEQFPYQRDKGKIFETLESLRKKYKNKSITGLIQKFGYPADWTKELVDNLPSGV